MKELQFRLRLAWPGSNRVEVAVLDCKSVQEARTLTRFWKSEPMLADATATVYQKISNRWEQVKM